jgi:cytochrome d ubiquinol oxidase subunit II
MSLADIPIVCVLIGLTLYVVLGGADFGAGLWQLTTLLLPRRSALQRERAQAIREHAHQSMGPVWEANHVWLIFVLTVTWTAYPRAFGSIASTLAVPLLIAGVGIVFRGAAYALRSGSSGARESALIDTVFSLSSVLTPFALGTMIGALVLETVPVGNAAGGIVSSWTHPFCLLLGALVVLLCAYLAAVYLAADAARAGHVELAARFRIRALGAAALAGALAFALLPVLHADAHHFFRRLLAGPGLLGVGVSVLGGLGTGGLVLARRYDAARASAALAVAGLIVGWALAQNPVFLPGLTVTQAAAPDQTLVVLLAAIAAGVVVLFPSLGLLFSLQLRGRFDGVAPDGAATAASRPASVGAVLASSRGGLAARGAVAGLLGGLGFLTAADAPWAHIVGVVSLAVCAGCALLAVGPAELAAEEPGGRLRGEQLGEGAVGLGDEPRRGP